LLALDAGKDSERVEGLCPMRLPHGPHPERIADRLPVHAASNDSSLGSGEHLSRTVDLPFREAQNRSRVGVLARGEEAQVTIELDEESGGWWPVTVSPVVDG